MMSVVRVVVMMSVLDGDRFHRFEYFAHGRIKIASRQNEMRKGARSIWARLRVLIAAQFQEFYITILYYNGQVNYGFAVAAIYRSD